MNITIRTHKAKAANEIFKFSKLRKKILERHPCLLKSILIRMDFFLFHHTKANVTAGSKVYFKIFGIPVILSLIQKQRKKVTFYFDFLC
jgi:hypothetical protein